MSAYKKLVRIANEVEKFNEEAGAALSQDRQINLKKVHETLLEMAEDQKAWKA
jgi:hypothetical protein